MVEKIVPMDDKLFKEFSEFIDRTNNTKPRDQKVTIRVLPEEKAFYRQIVNLTEFKNVSELIRESVRKQIKNIHIPSNPLEERFLTVFGIHRKIRKIIEKEVVEIENEIEKAVEEIDVTDLDEDLLIDFIQKMQMSSALGISLLRRKKDQENSASHSLQTH